jgi:hypothetical protein
MPAAAFAATAALLLTAYGNDQPVTVQEIQAVNS